MIFQAPRLVEIDVDFLDKAVGAAAALVGSGTFRAHSARVSPCDRRMPPLARTREPMDLPSCFLLPASPPPMSREDLARPHVLTRTNLWRAQPCIGTLETIRDEVAHLSRHDRHEALRPLCGAAGANKTGAVDEAKAATHHRARFNPMTRSMSLLEIQEEQAEWDVPTVHGTPPAPRGGHCAHLHRETLFTFGGCSVGTRSRCYNDVNALELDSLTWSAVAPAGTPPHPASRVACAPAGASLAIFGGYSGTYSNAVHLFTGETRTWTRAQPAGTPPKARAGASFTRAASSIILFGGADDVMAYNDVHVLSLDGTVWHTPPTRCAPAPCLLPTPREGHSASLVGTKLWVYGGVGRVGRAYTGLTHLAYLDTTTWTWHDPSSQMQSSESALSPRSLHAAVTLGSRLLLLGGLMTPKRTRLGDAAILDAETFSWSRPEPRGHPPAARDGSSITLRGRILYSFGGCGESACTDELRTLKFQYQRRTAYDPSHSTSSGVAGGNAMALAGPPVNGLRGACPANCSAHGNCWMGRCLCDPGWEGHDCALAQSCECNGRGFCGHGRCFCDPGYDGPHCEIAAQCPSNCTGHGSCVHGRCTCDAGYSGSDCADIVQCPGEGGPCSLRGICVNGLCFCNAGASGDGCEVTLPCPGAPDSPCHGNGVCWESKCFCAPGWAGVGCDEQLPCPNDCRDDDGVQRGRCHYGACVCDPGFTGTNCSFIASCENDCSHHGVCYLDKCECEPGYGGSDCSEVLFECLNNCTGHGACRLGDCMCNPNWSGADCSVRMSCPRDCSAHGICFNGHCLCEEGYGGVDCGVELISCPNECSHRGLCMHGVMRALPSIPPVATRGPSLHTARGHACPIPPDLPWRHVAGVLMRA